MYGSTPSCVRTRAELIEWLECEPDDPEVDTWTRFHVPHTHRKVFLPDPWSSWWDSVVDVVDTSRGSSGSGGPMTRERGESICRSGPVWFLLIDDDGDYTIRIVGEFRDDRTGREAAARASRTLCVAAPGRIVSLLVDTEEEGTDDDVYDGSSDPDDSWDDRVDPAWERLTRTAIVSERGLVLAGPGATSALPSEHRWVVLPATDTMRGVVDGLGGDAVSATLTVDGDEQAVVLTDAIGRIAALRVAAAAGIDAIHELDTDAIRSLDCRRGEITATALRDRT